MDPHKDLTTPCRTESNLHSVGTIWEGCADYFQLLSAYVCFHSKVTWVSTMLLKLALIKIESKGSKLLSENTASSRNSFKGEAGVRHFPFRDWFLGPER